jgi:hypothetical protein
LLGLFEVFFHLFYEAEDFMVERNFCHAIFRIFRFVLLI